MDLLLLRPDARGLAPYLRPRIDEAFQKVQEYFAAPRPKPKLTAGYDSHDFTVVFGG